MENSIPLLGIEMGNYLQPTPMKSFSTLNIITRDVKLHLERLHCVRMFSVRFQRTVAERSLSYLRFRATAHFLPPPFASFFRLYRKWIHPLRIICMQIPPSLYYPGKYYFPLFSFTFSLHFHFTFFSFLCSLFLHNFLYSNFLLSYFLHLPGDGERG